MLEAYSSSQGKDEDTDLTKTIKSSILDYMNTKCSDPEDEELINMASFLDPRIRTQHLSQRDIMVIKARVVSSSREVELVSAMPSGSATSETSPESIEEAQSVSKKKRKSLGSFFKFTGIIL
ncbi:E3 SUMO-protein ligase ZBED1-like protein [Lates japonicus]|uniref:E3 SUMO-protein ligase ZBED1-like protein n=1 Tax=Lates japonicus TaxID=270547 RepID=A0AAD3N0W3_LATJO|nr:E3 SUMO-protein ligase ZBED1-like protein [Lates japonicus]